MCRLWAGSLGSTLHDIISFYPHDKNVQEGSIIIISHENNEVREVR